jgi:hypothetical protein
VASFALRYGFRSGGHVGNGEPTGFGETCCGDRGRAHRECRQVERGLKNVERRTQNAERLIPMRFEPYRLPTADRQKARPRQYSVVSCHGQ